MTRSNWLLHFISTLMMIIKFSKSSSIPNIMYTCSNTTMFPNNSQFQRNLNTVFQSLSTKANDENPTRYDTDTAGKANREAVYGLFICRGYLNASSCQDCVTTATSIDLPKTYCPNRKDAIIWYEECMVRYSNVSFFGKLDMSPYVEFWNIKNVSDFGEFNKTLRSMFNNLINGVVGDPNKYATTVVTFPSFPNLIYAMAQCTLDLTNDDCNLCLNNSVGIIPISSGGRIYTPNCYLRYDRYPFYVHVTDNYLPMTPPATISFSTQPPLFLPASPKTPQAKTSHLYPPAGANGKTKQFMHIFLSIIIPMSIVISTIVYFGIRRFLCKRKSTEAFNNVGIDEILAAESLRFDLNMIRSATSNFSADNKLGEGGFGEVYKGKLESGQEIAVKRLSTDSKQGINEFKTEVILVAKLQHKNLVKLLGFCVASTEKILIYEFLSNSSLDRFLFQPTKKACLDWQTRFNIILGIARGLLYLHEDSRLKVIHRDLKSSNVLLDEGMNPKISDFGLARLFGVNETQGDTKRIVGTYGYMAPEYAITGHYSVKSDVYSFGVIVLEIVSGQRNTFFRLQLEEALLHRAWRLWTENKALDLVDSTLCNNFPSEQLIQCIHIGLLCIQEDAFERPRMGPIVAALNGQSVSLSTPKAPHIFRSDTSAENGNALDKHSSSIYTGGEQMTELYPRD